MPARATSHAEPTLRQLIARARWHNAAIAVQAGFVKFICALEWAKYNPDQPRVPAGSSEGGRWSSGGSDPRVQLAELQPNQSGPGRVISDAPSGAVRLAQGEPADPAENAPPEPDPKEEEPLRRGQPMVTIPPQERGFWYGLLWTDLNNEEATALHAADALASRYADYLRELEPSWQPSVGWGWPTLSSQLARLNEIAFQARARLAQIRSGNPGNFPLDYIDPGAELRDPNNGGIEPDEFRSLQGLPDIGDEPADRTSDGTVARAEVDGQYVYGTNSNAPYGYQVMDRLSAISMRRTLLIKYPNKMTLKNIGQKYNDSVFHAEATSLLRLARNYGGTLRGKQIKMTVDRKLCPGCEKILPLIATELGDPDIVVRDGIGRVYDIQGGYAIQRR